MLPKAPTFWLRNKQELLLQYLGFLGSVFTGTSAEVRTGLGHGHRSCWMCQQWLSRNSGGKVCVSVRTMACPFLLAAVGTFHWLPCCPRTTQTRSHTAVSFLVGNPGSGLNVPLMSDFLLMPRGVCACLSFPASHCWLLTLHLPH